eukprot:GILK01001882.1.p1 GENE.GILK01001882.1~~GILK01001882.1.p1  ORF type:complete len:471 (+),score=121.16 GILK01001882.1:79-1491(+)
MNVNYMQPPYGAEEEMEPYDEEAGSDDEEVIGEEFEEEMDEDEDDGEEEDDEPAEDEEEEEDDEDEDEEEDMQESVPEQLHQAYAPQAVMANIYKTPARPVKMETFAVPTTEGSQKSMPTPKPKRTPPAKKRSSPSSIKSTPATQKKTALVSTTKIKQKYSKLLNENIALWRRVLKLEFQLAEEKKQRRKHRSTLKRYVTKMFRHLSAGKDIRSMLSPIIFDEVESESESEGSSHETSQLLTGAHHTPAQVDSESEVSDQFSDTNGQNNGHKRKSVSKSESVKKRRKEEGERAGTPSAMDKNKMGGLVSFFKENKEKVQLDNPELSEREIPAVISKKWKSLSEAERAQYGAMTPGSAGQLTGGSLGVGGGEEDIDMLDESMDMDEAPTSPMTGEKKNKGKDKSKKDAKDKITRQMWTEEEDKKFFELYYQYGKAWKKIQSHLPAKTREQVQSHGRHLIKIGKLEDIEPRA